jgi:hypothetical protein
MQNGVPFGKRLFTQTLSTHNNYQMSLTLALFVRIFVLYYVHND